jgi:hypothetical protein
MLNLEIPEVAISDTARLLSLKSFQVDDSLIILPFN